MNHYIVATIHPWNIEAFNNYSTKISGTWHLVTHPEQLTAELLDAINPKYIFFPHWSWIVDKKIHESYNCICFHMTDLPFGRGGSPLQNLIIRGIKQTKVSALKMTDELDAGPIFMKQPMALTGSAEEIFKRTANIVAKLIEQICLTSPQPKKQHGEVTTFARRTAQESEIPENLSTEQLYDFIRMLDAPSYPKAFIRQHNKIFEFSNAKIIDGNIQAETKIIATSNKQEP